jgi:hypothetical protein
LLLRTLLRMLPSTAADVAAATVSLALVASVAEENAISDASPRKQE